MATIKTKETNEVEIEVTAEYCYSQAAQALNRSEYTTQSPELAREWRALGDSLRDASK